MTGGYQENGLSWRKPSRQLGLELKGDSANVYWGAFDAIIKSDVSREHTSCVL